MPRFVVVGDIGGTNFRLRVSEIKGERLMLIEEIIYSTKEYVSFKAFIDTLLAKNSIS